MIIIQTTAPYRPRNVIVKKPILEFEVGRTIKMWVSPMKKPDQRIMIYGTMGQFYAVMDNIDSVHDHFEEFEV